MRVAALVRITFLAIFLPIPLLAEAPDRRWYFGGGISFLSTTDDMRNNAAIVFTRRFGDDGIPFTGDPNERITCQPNPGNFFPLQDPFCDPRPDNLLARDGMIEDGFKYDLTVGYQLTQRIGLQLDAGYYKGEIGPIDVFETRTFPPIGRTGLPGGLVDRQRSTPIAAGVLTEIPISLTGIVHFRNQKPLRPYFGVGFGIILTDIKVSDDIQEIKTRFDSLRVRGIGDELGKDLTELFAPGFKDTLIREDGLIPFHLPFSVGVDDAFEWHLTSGLEFFFNNRFSLVFDARYMVADQEVVIDLGGQDQLDIIFWPPELFRPDGSLKVFINLPIAPNTVCGGIGVRFGCFGAEMNERVNPEGLRFNPRDPNNPLPGVTCPAIGDFDRDGKQDVCYKVGSTSPSGLSVSTGSAVVQGGTIELTAFTIALGFRIHL